MRDETASRAPFRFRTPSRSRLPGRGPALLAPLAAALLACASAAPSYAPQQRFFVVTTVPLLTREIASVYPFLREDFAPGGVLEGKEVYAFVPNTLTVVEGDTLELTLVNPEDDQHRFVLPDLAVELPPQSITRATWRAARAGIFPFACTVPEHVPAMYGQIVVLPASVGAGFADATAHAAP
jgi:uncharacterized cupredoxin-like copper-binding protein